MATVTPRQLNAIANAVHTSVANRNKPVVADRQTRPLLSFLRKRAIKRAWLGGKIQVKMARNGTLDLEFWEGRDRLTFKENDNLLQMEFTPARVHIGQEFVHANLADLGFEVMPNEKRGKGFARKMSAAEMDILVDAFMTMMDDMSENYDRQLDEQLHLDGTQDSKAFVGLAGFLPMANTAGTIGGQPRTDPLFQHHVASGLTVTANGTLERGLQNLIRAAELNNSGTASKIDAIFAGYDFIDGYIAYARANDMPYERNGGTSAVKNLDIGLPDSAIHFNGIPIIHNPTYERLDAAGYSSIGGSVAWTKRAYLLAGNTWKLGHGLDKHFSAPMDEGDQRVTKVSYDGRYGLELSKPNGNAVASIA